MDIKKLKFLKIIIFCFILIVINTWVIYPLLKGEYTQQMGSIETAFIADAKFIIENFPNLSWNPQWYLGFPFHLFYNPLLPFLMAFFNWLIPAISISHIYRIITAISFILSPVSLYFFVQYLTKKHFAAMITALSFSLFSPLTYYFKSMALFASNFNNPPWRLLVLTPFGEGPHTISLVFIPLATLFFLRTIRDFNFRNFLLAIIFIVATALTNWIGFTALVVILAITLFSEIVFSPNEIKGKLIKRALIISLVAYGLSAFWLNLSFLKNTLFFGQEGRDDSMLNTWRQESIYFIFIISLMIFGLTILLDRKSIQKKKFNLQPFFLASLWALIFFIVVAAWNFYKKAYLSQPNRFLPEMEMGIAILFGLIASFIFNYFSKIKKKYPLGPILGVVFCSILFGVMDYFSLPFLKTIHSKLTPNSDITKTYEYQIAKWLKENTRGERIYISGSGAFWLNSFTDVPQVRGAADPAATHPWWAHANYQILRGEDAEVSLDWLRALNVSYIIVNKSPSGDAFPDFQYPNKFDNLLEKIHNIGGDTIYKAPLKNPLLSQVVDLEKAKELKTPLNGADKENIEKYANWVENDSGAPTEFKWLNHQTAEIKAKVKENEALSLQITYDPGWQAYSNGKKIKIEKDVIGNMIVFLLGAGEYNIQLKHGKTWDIWLGYLLTLITIISLAYFRKIYTD